MANPSPVVGKAHLATLDANSLLTEIRNPELNSLALLALWNNRFEDDALWSRETISVEAYQTLARRLLKAGLPHQALAVVNGGLEFWSKDILLRQMKGLALSRTGAPRQSAELLAAVWGEIENRTDVSAFVVEETLGTLASAYKEFGTQAADENRRTKFWAQADQLYRSAYRRSRGIWTGINAATLATLLGAPERAKTLAAEVRQRCDEELDLADDDMRFWRSATLGEAALNLQDWRQAEHHYTQAGLLGRTCPGHLVTTRKQARLLLLHAERDIDVLDTWLPLPRVVVFSGHTLDRDNRERERFPPRQEHAVKAAIKDWLRRHNTLIGFSSAANGSDILFQEALAELKGEANVFIPHNVADFLQRSVLMRSFEENHGWQDRFQAVLKRANRLHVPLSKSAHVNCSYDFANEVLFGLAKVRAKEFEASVIGLAVWDGLDGEEGGTSTAVARWHRSGIPVFRIDPSGSPSAAVPRLSIVECAPPSAKSTQPTAGQGRSDLRAPLLFLDLENFGSLSDAEVKLFVRTYLRRVAVVVRKYVKEIDVREIWGDGLFLAFRSFLGAGKCALELAEMTGRTQWHALGFNQPLRTRILLHTGNVYSSKNPITGGPYHFGTGVCRDTLLDSNVPSGQVYSTPAFAALASLAGADDLVCRYVEQLPWDNGYYKFPAYIVRRSASALRDL